MGKSLDQKCHAPMPPHNPLPTGDRGIRLQDLHAGAVLPTFFFFFVLTQHSVQVTRTATDFSRYSQQP